MTIIGQLDAVFGEGFISFMRDPAADNITVSLSKLALAKNELPFDGWRFVMGSKFAVRTMTVKEWKNYVAQAQKARS